MYYHVRCILEGGGGVNDCSPKIMMHSPELPIFGLLNPKIIVVFVDSLYFRVHGSKVMYKNVCFLPDFAKSGKNHTFSSITLEIYTRKPKLIPFLESTDHFLSFETLFDYPPKKIEKNHI